MYVQAIQTRNRVMAAGRSGGALYCLTALVDSWLVTTWNFRCRDILRGHTSANEMTHAISTGLTYTAAGNLHFVDGSSVEVRPAGRLAGWLVDGPLARDPVSRQTSVSRENVVQRNSLTENRNRETLDINRTLDFST